MNNLAVQHLEPVSDRRLAEEMAALPPYLRREIALRAVQWGVAEGVQEWMKNGGDVGMGGLGQDSFTEAIAVAVERVIKPLVPALRDELLAIAEPAAKRAAEVVGPAVGAELQKRLLPFAIIAGLVAAVFGVIGMMAVGGYIVKKVG